MRLKLTAATHQTECNRDGRPRGDVVVICLEHDVVMQGRDQHDAVMALEAGIALIVQHAENSGEDPLTALRGPPPAEEVAQFTGPRISMDFDTDDWTRT